MSDINMACNNIEESYLYRFRSIKQLIGEYNELEQQEFYYATQEQLNDPMEGLKTIIWNGDGIVWQKLLEHYVHCVAQLIHKALINNNQLLNKSDIPLIPYEFDFTQDLYKDFLTNTVVKVYLEYRTQHHRPTDKNELYFHLWCLHGYASASVIRTFKKLGLLNIPESVLVPTTEKDILDYFANYFLQAKATDVEVTPAQWNYKVARQMLDMITLHMQFTNGPPNSLFMANHFPREYVNLLERHMFPEWGVISFSANCSNIAMWGYYADNHKGVALKFKTHKDQMQNNLVMRLYDVSSYSGEPPQYNSINNIFHQVKYGYEAFDSPIDFFRNLGRLPIPDLLRWWYYSGDKKSVCAEDIFEDEDNWRKKYWEYFLRCITTKHKHWEHENEYRLVKTNSFRNFSNNRTVKYHFEDLEGIIFGIQTAEEDKIKIINIIKLKCRSLFAKVQDFVHKDVELDYQAQIKLIEVLRSNNVSKICLEAKISLPALNTSNVNNYKEILCKLCSNREFNDLTNTTNGAAMKFYQAYYCNLDHEIKHDPIQLFSQL